MVVLPRSREILIWSRYAPVPRPSKSRLETGHRGQVGKIKCVNLRREGWRVETLVVVGQGLYMAGFVHGNPHQSDASVCEKEQCLGVSTAVLGQRGGWEWDDESIDGRNSGRECRRELFKSV